MIVLYIELQTNTSCTFGITIEQIEIVKNAYLNGKKDFFIGGKKVFLSNLHSINLFQYEGDVTKEIVINDANQKGLLHRYGFPDIDYFKKYFTEITSDFIGNTQYGENNKDLIFHTKENYISEVRISQIESIKSNGYFNVEFLLLICTELNKSWKAGNFLSVIYLVRTLLNHIPPIFEQKNFEGVVSQYNGKSIGKILDKLQSTSKNTADYYLHCQINLPSKIPTPEQVKYIGELDHLLDECIMKIESIK